MSNLQRAYHDNGVIRFESEFVGGVPHGLQRHWHSNGVLEREIPFDHGAIDGMVRQWNDKGELLGSCEVNGGTGTYRMWHPNGKLMIETSFLNRKTTGRERTYFEDGDLIGETYWLENEKVSKKRYLEACKQNPNLPQYEQEPTARAKNPVRKKAIKLSSRPSPPPDDLPLNLLQGPRVREALSWLEESSQPSRSVGEATGQDESIRLIKKLYSLGAVAVQTVEIDGETTEDQNTGRIVIELPHDWEMRCKLLKFCGKLAREAGFDPESDVGQRYMLLMLD